MNEFTTTVITTATTVPVIAAHLTVITTIEIRSHKRRQRRRGEGVDQTPRWIFYFYFILDQGQIAV